MIFRYLAYLPVYLLSVFFVYLTANLWASYSVKKGLKTLPGKWSWLHTTDDDLDGGQHQLGWPSAEGKALSKQRAAWLRRNPAGGIASYLLGFPVEGTTKETQESGVPNSGTYLRKTKFFRDQYNASNYDKYYFEYRRDFKWCPWFYWKLWFGWTSDERAGYHRFQFQMFNMFRKVP